jgi:hypothetical protein
MSVTSNTPGAQAYLIPLANTPQSFQIPLAGATYTFTSKWNDMGQYWALDIADVNDVAIVSNIPLITGGDCLAGLNYLEFDGSIYVLTDGASPDAVPTLANLGIDSNVYFVTVNANE